MQNERFILTSAQGDLIPPLY